MSKQDVTVSVEKSGMDLMQHLAAIVKAVKLAHASGAQLQVAIPSDITALIANLPSMIQDAQAMGGEFADDKVAFIKGVNIGAYDMIDAIKG